MKEMYACIVDGCYVELEKKDVYQIAALKIPIKVIERVD